MAVAGYAATSNTHFLSFLVLVSYPRPPDAALLKRGHLVVASLSPSQGGEIFFPFSFFFLFESLALSRLQTIAKKK